MIGVVKFWNEKGYGFISTMRNSNDLGGSQNLSFLLFPISKLAAAALIMMLAKTQTGGFDMASRFSRILGSYWGVGFSALLFVTATTLFCGSRGGASYSSRWGRSPWLLQSKSWRGNEKRKKEEHQTTQSGGTETNKREKLALRKTLSLRYGTTTER